MVKPPRVSQLLLIRVIVSAAESYCSVCEVVDIIDKADSGDGGHWFTSFRGSLCWQYMAGDAEALR